MHTLPPFLDSPSFCCWKGLLDHRFALRHRQLQLLQNFRSLSDDPLCPFYLKELCSMPTLLDERQVANKTEGDQQQDGHCRGICPHGLKGLTVDQVDTVVVALAQFHAFSLACFPCLAIDGGANCVLPELTQADPQNEVTLKEWLMELLSSLPECDYFLKNRRTLANFCRRVPLGRGPIDRWDVQHYSPLDPNFAKHIPVVMCHGNLCAENIQFLAKNSVNGDCSPSSAESVVLLNWELAHPGFGVSDLVHLLLSSVNSSIRLRNLDHWFTLYTSKFEEFCLVRQRRDKTLSNLMGKKAKMRREWQRQAMDAQIPIQLMRVLPKLATEYRSLVEVQEEADETDQKGGEGRKRSMDMEREKCALRGRMVGGFEMVRKRFEEQ